MLDEVKKITKYLKTNQGILQLRNRILLILAVFLILLAVNRFIFINFTDKGEFYLAITRTKIAFAGNVSVYDIHLQLDSVELAKHGIDPINNVDPFLLPLYALVFYYPFMLITNFEWSLALWMTINQVLVYFIIFKFLKVINWKINDKNKWIITLISLLAYFVLDNIFLVDLSIIQTMLIVYALDKIKTRDYIFAGILLGIASFDPYQFFIPLLIIFLLNIRGMRGIVNGWNIISIVLMSLLLIIFDMRWFLEMIKALVVNPIIFPFTSYGNYVSSAFPNIRPAFLGVIPIMVFIWLAIEWMRTPKENFIQELWIISLGFVLNAFLHMWVSPYSTFPYLLVFIYTISLWFNRATKKFKYFALGLNAILFLVLPLGNMIVNQAIIDTSSSYLYNILASIVLLLSLYWVRLWIANPYFSVNPIED